MEVSDCTPVAGRRQLVVLVLPGELDQNKIEIMTKKKKQMGEGNGWGRVETISNLNIQKDNGCKITMKAYYLTKIALKSVLPNDQRG